MNRFREESENRQEISGEDFEGYYAPESLKKAVALLADKGDRLKIIAGGTDILVAYYDKLYQVEGWLDLKNLGELRELELYQDRIEIGALITHKRLEKDKIIKKQLPVLASAAYSIGSPQIRNRGTVGGNIVTASPAGDLLPALIAYDASFILASTRGDRIIRAENFFAGPKKTVLAADEILTKVIVPLPDSNTFGSWIKIGKRKALIIASINLALVITFDNNMVIKEVRASLGAVAPTPVRIKDIEQVMIGKRIEELDYDLPGELVQKGISPINDIRGTKEYREDVARNIMINALQEIERMVSKR